MSFLKKIFKPKTILSWFKSEIIENTEVNVVSLKNSEVFTIRVLIFGMVVFEKEFSSQMINVRNQIAKSYRPAKNETVDPRDIVEKTMKDIELKRDSIFDK